MRHARPQPARIADQGVQQEGGREDRGRRDVEQHGGKVVGCATAVNRENSVGTQQDKNGRTTTR